MCRSTSLKPVISDYPFQSGDQRPYKRYIMSTCEHISRWFWNSGTRGRPSVTHPARGISPHSSRAFSTSCRLLPRCVTTSGHLWTRNDFYEVTTFAVVALSVRLTCRRLSRLRCEEYRYRAVVWHHQPGPALHGEEVSAACLITSARPPVGCSKIPDSRWTPSMRR